MNAGAAVGAWAGVGAGVGALALAGVLLHRTLRVTLEIRRYAEDIAEAGQGIQRNTDLAPELATMRSLAGQVRRRLAGSDPAGAP